MTDGYEGSGLAKADELDRVLDLALVKYAAVEPRAGLEGRVLANLRTEHRKIADRVRWKGRVAAVAMVIVVAVMLGWRPGRPTPPIVAKRSPVTTPSALPELMETKQASRFATQVPHGRLAPPRTKARTKAIEPKLGQFPSSRPLSHEEQLLVRYVQEFPEEAAVTAKAQADSEKEIEQFIGSPDPGGPEQQHDQSKR
jgi:hypothetical protein